MQKKVNIVIGVIIILVPTIITGEFLFISQQFYPSGITFVVGIDYFVRAACFCLGLLLIRKGLLIKEDI